MLFAACNAPAADELLEKAEAEILAENYAGAETWLKQLLSAEPMNAGGHYYIQEYMHEQVNTVIR